MKARLFTVCISVFIILYSAAGFAQTVQEYRTPMKPQMENSLRARQLAKTVYESKLIADMENPDRAGASWQMRGIADMSFTNERSIDGSRSLRFRSPYRNEEFIRKTTKENGYFNAGSGSGSSAQLTFAEEQNWTGIQPHFPLDLSAFPETAHVCCAPQFFMRGCAEACDLAAFHSYYSEP